MQPEFPIANAVVKLRTQKKNATRISGCKRGCKIKELEKKLQPYLAVANTVIKIRT